MEERTRAAGTRAEPDRDRDSHQRIPAPFSRAGFPVALEKMYIDALLDDGSVLLLYLGSLAGCGGRVGLVTADLIAPDGWRQAGSARAWRVSADATSLRFGPAMLRGETVQFATPGLAGSLHYRVRAEPVGCTQPVVAEGRRRLWWSVEVPDAEVTGVIAWPDGSSEVHGRGYRDRVWFDFPPGAFPIRRLVWGRAVAGPHAATWMEAATRTGVVRSAWLDGRELAPTGDVRPPEVGLGPSWQFLDADVVDLPGLGLGGLRPLARRLTGNPHETKWLAPAEIAGHAGCCVHEVVTWRC